MWNGETGFLIGVIWESQLRELAEGRVPHAIRETCIQLLDPANREYVSRPGPDARASRTPKKRRNVPSVRRDSGAKSEALPDVSGEPERSGEPVSVTTT